MKQTFTLSIAVVFCFVMSASAQIKKGSMMLGGAITGYSNNLKNPDSSIAKLNGFTIAPAFGFAVNTNTILGVSLLYGTRTNKYYGVSDDQKDHTYGAGVFLRRYKLLAKNFYLFGDGNLMYSRTDYNYSIHNVGPDYDSKSNDLSFNITPAIAYNLTSSIQLESGLQNLVSVSYGMRKETPKNAAGGPAFKENSFNIGTSLNAVSLNSIFVGVRFLFQ